MTETTDCILKSSQKNIMRHTMSNSEDIIFILEFVIGHNAVHNFLGPTKKKQKWILKTRVLAFSAFLLTSFFISTVYCLKSF